MRPSSSSEMSEKGLSWQEEIGDADRATSPGEGGVPARGGGGEREEGVSGGRIARITFSLFSEMNLILD